MRKLKILHLIKSLGRGGAEMLLPETLKLHDQETFEFHYLYFLPWKDQLVESLQSVGAAQVTCLSASNNLKMLLKRSDLIAYVRQHQIDLVHCHLPWAGFVGRSVFKALGIPIVYSEHNKQERYHFATYWLNKLTFNQQSMAIAVSEDVKASIIQHITPKVPVQTILNGVNTAYFQRDTLQAAQFKVSLGFQPTDIIVGTVAVFRFQKRLIEWLQVMKQVCDQDPNYKGIIVGAGPLEAEVIAERKRLGLEEKVLMPGLQTNTKDWFGVMDIFMMTSVFEGLPIALLEAMSMSCGVIATKAGGVGEVIRDQQDGLLVDVDQWNDLANHALALKDETLRLQLATAARERVANAFSLQTMVDQLEAVYQRLLDR